MLKKKILSALCAASMIVGIGAGAVLADEETSAPITVNLLADPTFYVYTEAGVDGNRPVTNTDDANGANVGAFINCGPASQNTVVYMVQASYKEDGRLLDILWQSKVVSSTANNTLGNFELDGSVKTEQGCTVKCFLWNMDMSPAMNAAAIGPKGSTPVDPVDPVDDTVKLVSYSVNGQNADINTKDNIIWLEKTDDERTITGTAAAAASSEDAAVSYTCATAGNVTEGDTVTVTPKDGDPVTYTIKFDILPMDVDPYYYKGIFSESFENVTIEKQDKFLSSAQTETDGYWMGQGAEHNLGALSIEEENGNKFLKVYRPNTCGTWYGFSLMRCMDGEKHSIYKASFEQKVNISDVTGDGMFFSYGQADKGWMRLCFVPNNSGKIDVRYDVSGSNGTSDTKITSIDFNNWYDIKTVFRCSSTDGSGATAEFYIDGKFIGSTDAVSSQNRSYCTVYAWNMHTFAGSFVTAEIDDVNVRIYKTK